MRSAWKAPYIHTSIINKVKSNSHSNGIKVWSRASTILEEFVNYRFLVHNGKYFYRIHVKYPMVGYKFGEFSYTKKNAIYKKKKKKGKISSNR